MCLGIVTRAELGLPEDWYRIEDWIYFEGPTNKVVESVVEVKKLKHDYIPLLDDYSVIPEDVWKKFPFNDLPKVPYSTINTEKLGQYLEDRKEGLRDQDSRRGQRVVKYLKEGAPSHQMADLPPVFCKNTPSAIDNGGPLTDTIADWTEKKCVAGPFKTPPLRKFRVNPIMIVDNKGKKRPVLNVSSPAGHSFNDNVRSSCLEKVYMSSAKRFSLSVLKAGRFGKMTKFDMQNAYKHIPCKIEDLRLQGFNWGGRFFVETAQIFGARTSVANYDMLGNIVLALALTNCNIPRTLVHRQLDDVPVVGPRKTDWCEKFTEEYEKICSDIGIKLAEDCPKKDKAFKLSQTGKVLGIEFDTVTLSWRLPEDKRQEYMNAIHAVLEQEELGVEESQEVLGKLNFVCSMASYMRPFLRTTQNHLKMLLEAELSSCPMLKETRTDLLIWWAFLRDNESWLPIQDELENPPLKHKVFTTDAAGWRVEESATEVGVGGGWE